MTIELSLPPRENLRPRLTVFGVGGGGGNAVNNMVSCGLEGVEFVAANTDAQALGSNLATRRIQLGAEMTEGLGAGGSPQTGAQAAEESIDEITDALSGSHMVFVTAGMGGGTGTGAAPVIARASRELGILTVGVVTKPFGYEGERRMEVALRGLEELQEFVDTLIVIPNQNLFRRADEKMLVTEAFAMADRVLHAGVAGITDLMVKPGLINLDFADVRSVMDETGKAVMGTGEGSGEGRAVEAAEAAISNPLLDDTSMKGARALLLNVTGGPDLTLYEVDEASNRIRAEVDGDARIIAGAALDEAMEGKVRVSIVATGIREEGGVGKGLRPTLRVVGDEDGLTRRSMDYEEAAEVYEEEAVEEEPAAMVSAAAPTQSDLARTQSDLARTQSDLARTRPDLAAEGEAIMSEGKKRGFWSRLFRRGEEDDEVFEGMDFTPPRPLRAPPERAAPRAARASTQMERVERAERVEREELRGDPMEEELEIPTFMRRR